LPRNRDAETENVRVRPDRVTENDGNVPKGETVNVGRRDHSCEGKTR
jgi:hypothetical protein